MLHDDIILELVTPRADQIEHDISKPTCFLYVRPRQQPAYITASSVVLGLIPGSHPCYISLHTHTRTHAHGVRLGECTGMDAGERETHMPGLVHV